jgi:hypothetical protein
VSIGQGEVSWVVMAGPDGNLFDVLRRSRPLSWPGLEELRPAPHAAWPDSLISGGSTVGACTRSAA